MANETTGRDSDKFMLRLPDGMREEIAEAARANKRSMNAEIVARLQASLSPDATTNYDKYVEMVLKKVSENIVKETSKLIEVEHNRRASKPDFVVSYFDGETGEQRTAIIETKFDKSLTKSAVEQLKHYAKIDDNVHFGVVAFNDGEYLFDLKNNREVGDFPSRHLENLVANIISSYFQSKIDDEDKSRSVESSDLKPEFTSLRPNFRGGRASFRTKS